MATLIETMEALYHSEINCGISSFWDDGFKIWLGDHINGETDYSSFGADELDTEASRWLHEVALKRYPQSDYAKSQMLKID